MSTEWETRTPMPTERVAFVVRSQEYEKNRFTEDELARAKLIQGLILEQASQLDKDQMGIFTLANEIIQGRNDIFYKVFYNPLTNSINGYSAAKKRRNLAYIDLSQQAEDISSSPEKWFTYGSAISEELTKRAATHNLSTS